MVTKIARRAALPLVGLLALMATSCPFFFTTPFPAMLTMAEKVTDLSKDVPSSSKDDCGDCLNLHLLNGYLFLTLPPGRLIILDPELRVLKKYDGGYAGRLGAFDGAMYFVGSETIGLALEQTGPSSYPGGNRAFVNGGTVVALWSDFGLLYGSGGSSWSTTISSELHFEDVGADAGNAYLFFSVGGWDQSRVFTSIGPSELTGAGPSPMLAGYSFFDLPGADRSRFHVINGGIDNGIVIRSKGTYQRYDKLTGALLDSLPGSGGSSDDNYADAFEPLGEYFYYYDGSSKKIYKCRTWW